MAPRSPQARTDRPAPGTSRVTARRPRPDRNRRSTVKSDESEQGHRRRSSTRTSTSRIAGRTAASPCPPGAATRNTPPHDPRLPEPAPQHPTRPPDPRPQTAVRSPQSPVPGPRSPGPACAGRTAQGTCGKPTPTDPPAVDEPADPQRRRTHGNTSEAQFVPPVQIYRRCPPTQTAKHTCRSTPSASYAQSRRPSRDHHHRRMTPHRHQAYRGPDERPRPGPPRRARGPHHDSRLRHPPPRRATGDLCVERRDDPNRLDGTTSGRAGRDILVENSLVSLARNLTRSHGRVLPATFTGGRDDIALNTPRFRAGRIPSSPPRRLSESSR